MISKRYLFFLATLCLFLIRGNVYAQFNNMPGGNGPQHLNNDKNDSLQEKWKEEKANIYYKHLNSEIKYIPDTLLGNMHHFQNTQPWWGNNLGNDGTAVRNLLFTPKQTLGLSLGYAIYDLYKIKLDSLGFYNTTRPYSSFSFLLGSKEEQNVNFLHTQNISPNWNVAAQLRYNASEGFFAQQKATNLSSSITSNYKSKNDRYNLNLAFIYNKFSQNENGGIVSDSFLNLSNYSDRRRIPVNFPLSGTNSSAVTNSLNNIDLYVQNNYSWGTTDTLYNEDSTKATYHFTPRFRLQYELSLHSETHIFKDLQPDSNRYSFIQPISIGFNDSLYGAQKWLYLDNKFSLNGFIGKSQNLAAVRVGIANRIDHFQQSFISGKSAHNSTSNYIFGTINKEAIGNNAWAYQAKATLFITGPAIGDFNISALIGRDLGRLGLISIGVQQDLTEAPFAFQNFSTNFYKRTYNFNKVSKTNLWAKWQIPDLKFDLTLNNYLLKNYLYFDEQSTPQQMKAAFYVTQISGRKELRYQFLTLNNEVVWQQATSNTALNLPAFMIREQIKVETYIFKKALKVAMGLEARYNTPYFMDGYSAYFNQFYVQNSVKVNNLPEVAAFFNFKIKSFRAFLLFDQLQQFISPNNINAVGGYPAQNTILRFGFNWVLIN